jgi:hypothetical protein
MATVESTARTTISHRYPWSGEELAIIATFVLTPPVVTAVLWRSGGPPVVLAVTMHVLGWSAALALYVLGRRRKNASRVTATLTGSRLTVAGGRVKASAGDLSTAVRASTTTMGPETVLVVELSAGAVMVPGRIVRDPALAAVLDRHLLHGPASLSAGAHDLLTS